MTRQERAVEVDALDWYAMEGREATSILGRAVWHTWDLDAKYILNTLRDDLIDNGLEDEKTIWLLRRKNERMKRLHNSNGAHSAQS